MCLSYFMGENAACGVRYIIAHIKVDLEGLKAFN